MANKSLRVVLDSNILISAYVYHGKPESVLNLVIEDKIHAIISPALISELFDVLRKKFDVSKSSLLTIESEIKDTFEIVHPRESLAIVRDAADNRVLEAAVEGKCQYIVTGDKELLKFGSYKSIKIVTAEKFLKNV